MSRAEYYRQQAQLLLIWAFATNNSDYAARLEARACMFLAAAEKPEDPALRDLTPYLDEFNTEQMRKPDDAPSVRQQQQQAQPKKDKN
jgi:hypothetical protein